MKRTLFLLLSLALVVLAGCAKTNFTPPAACVDQPSLILERVPDPRALDQALLTVQLGALELVKGYTPADANKVLDDIERILTITDGLTYAEAVGIIISKVDVANARAGAIIFILGPDLTQLAEPIPISPCDLVLIRTHLTRQRALVAIYGGK
jgi:hypothetical protein